MRFDGSAWTFSPDDRQEAVNREQHALEALEGADPEFARAITAKLIPDRTKDRDVLRRTP